MDITALLRKESRQISRAVIGRRQVSGSWKTKELKDALWDLYSGSDDTEDGIVIQSLPCHVFYAVFSRDVRDVDDAKDIVDTWREYTEGKDITDVKSNLVRSINQTMDACGFHPQDVLDGRKTVVSGEKVDESTFNLQLILLPLDPTKHKRQDSVRANAEKLTAVIEKRISDRARKHGEAEKKSEESKYDHKKVIDATGTKIPA